MLDFIEVTQVINKATTKWELEELDQLRLDEEKTNQKNDKKKVKVLVKVKDEKKLSCVRLFETPWTVAYQSSLSMEFSRQEYLSGFPCTPPGDLPDPGRIEPGSPALQVDC